MSLVFLSFVSRTRRLLRLQRFLIHAAIGSIYTTKISIISISRNTDTDSRTLSRPISRYSLSLSLSLSLLLFSRASRGGACCRTTDLRADVCRARERESEAHCTRLLANDPPPSPPLPTPLSSPLENGHSLQAFSPRNAISRRRGAARRISASLARLRQTRRRNKDLESRASQERDRGAREREKGGEMRKGATGGEE
jgi:hypothetical protein